MADVPTTQEVRDAYEAAMAVAVAMTRSKLRAQEIVQNAFERILTTRPWSRAERTFAQHAANTARSLVLHARISKSDAHDKEAHEGFHRHGIGHSAPSPERRTLEHAEEEGQQSEAEGELDALDATLEDNPVARQVLRCRRETELTKAGEIAAKLGIPAAQVYRANEALKERLKTLRKSRTRP
jgi:RNA polymerase sigma factor (sigma-70 family)